jgi:hypothetical protein
MAERVPKGTAFREPHVSPGFPGEDFGRSTKAERLRRKQRLTATCRLFSCLGFDQGLAGHVTAQDPERTDHFWIDPLGRHFSQIRVSDLIPVNHDGETEEGDWPVNRTAFAIHSAIHTAHSDVAAAVHTIPAKRKLCYFSICRRRSRRRAPGHSIVAAALQRRRLSEGRCHCRSRR